ncbi:MAG: PDZ domain-containing protein [Gemmataceae bacterium]
MTAHQRLRLATPAALLLGVLLTTAQPDAGGQPPANGPSPPLPADYAKAFTWRCIGPANMSGRIVALAVYENDPTTWWAATSSAGLLKTTNGGMTLQHQFDKEGVSTVGDVCVAPSNKEIVWVGTGENNPRNSVSYGDGVYKSADGGKTWKNMGLKKSYQIGKILIHPTNPDVVYVGALGRLYGPSEERGLYKTTDGGKTWNKVLHVDDNTGVIDMAMHPADPETLLVATWERQRDGFDSWPGEVKKPDATDGYDPIKKWGKGAGLYRTTDGGEKFEKVTQGLPTCKMGRIGLDFCKKTPNVVYAVIDCENIGKGPAPLEVAFGGMLKDEPDRTVVRHVIPDSPAEKAGLKAGDVIEEVGGKKVTTFDQVLDQIRPRKPGEKVEFKVARGGESKAIALALTRRGGAGGRGAAGGPGGGRGGPGGAQPNPAYLGVIGEDDKGGVKLTQVTEESPAEKAGLMVGDVVVSLDGKKVADYDALLAALRERRVGDKVTFEVKRGADTRQIAATMADRGTTGSSRSRPFLGQLAGQNQNLQDQQGSKGFDYGGVYKSTDAGATWERVNSLNPRPMYFSLIRVDPSDPLKVYLLGVSYYKSNNGGVTFTPDLARGVHADGHAMWVDPKDGRHMLIGCDGGTYESRDAGANWDHFNHAAVGQFYHVALSPGKPYFAYGGLQDNGSWGGPSAIRGFSGPVNEDWISVGGGDGFTCRVDQNEPEWVYSTSQGGAMSRRNLKTGETGRIRPERARGQGGSHRFNWNTPFFLSNHNQKIFYAGSQYVLRSVKRGDDLKVISPELTLTKRGSMSALSESPLNPDVLWAGTDDGALWVTRDGGKEWTNLTKNVQLPAPRWVSTIEASHYKEGRCYVCFDGHRSDDDRPLLYVTEDFGKTWKPISSNLPQFGSTRVLREDHVKDHPNEGLLYCGTEFAFFVSLDRGQSWTKFNNNLPTVAVHEVAVHPTAGEVVAATHGRSLWVLDVSALRQMKPDQLASGTPLLFKPMTAERAPPAPQRGRTNRRFVGENPVPGAHIWYAVPGKANKITLKVVDIDNKVVRELRAGREAGLHPRLEHGARRAGRAAIRPARPRAAVRGRRGAPAAAGREHPPGGRPGWPDEGKAPARKALAARPKKTTKARLRVRGLRWRPGRRDLQGRPQRRWRRCPPSRSRWSATPHPAGFRFGGDEDEEEERRTATRWTIDPVSSSPPCTPGEGGPK